MLGGGGWVEGAGWRGLRGGFWVVWYQRIGAIGGEWVGSCSMRAWRCVLLIEAGWLDEVGGFDRKVPGIDG